MAFILLHQFQAHLKCCIIYIYNTFIILNYYFTVDFYIRKMQLLPNQGHQAGMHSDVHCSRNPLCCKALAGVALV